MGQLDIVGSVHGASIAAAAPGLLEIPIYVVMFFLCESNDNRKGGSISPLFLWFPSLSHLSSKSNSPIIRTLAATDPCAAPRFNPTDEWM